MGTSATNGLRPLREYEPPADNDLADELEGFLRDRYYVLEKAERSSGEFTSLHGRTCPRCGKPATGFRPGANKGMAATILHNNAPMTAPGCDLSTAELHQFDENGLTVEARYMLADVDAKLRILNDIDLHTPGVVHLRKLLALPFADHPDYRPEWAV